MIEYYVSVLKNYATFSGRARRKEFWMFSLCNFIIVAAFNILTSMVSALSVLSLIYSLAIFLPGLAVTVRRLQDINKKWVWIFITLIPLVGFIWILVLLCQEGTRGDNDFGPDPKA